VLVRSLSGTRQPGAEAEAEGWAESEEPGPPEPQQQQQSQHSHSQRQSPIQFQSQSSQSSLRGRIHSTHQLYDVLAAPGRRPPQRRLHLRPSVAPDLGREEATSLRSLAGPPQQQQQLDEPRP
jgi:hypothetical protein